MNRPAAPAVPNALALSEALQRSVPLADLRRRLQESAICLNAIKSSLPAGLLPHVQAGPIDAEAWTLLAANASVAAKLKQLRPRLEQALTLQACPARVIRIKLSQQHSA